MRENSFGGKSVEVVYCAGLEEIFVGGDPVEEVLDAIFKVDLRLPTKLSLRFAKVSIRKHVDRRGAIRRVPP